MWDTVSIGDVLSEFWDRIFRVAEINLTAGQTKEIVTARLPHIDLSVFWGVNYTTHNSQFRLHLKVFGKFVAAWRQGQLLMANAESGETFIFNSPVRSSSCSMFFFGQSRRHFQR